MSLLQLPHTKVPILPVIDGFDTLSRGDALKELTDVLEQIMGPGHVYAMLKKHPQPFWPEGFKICQPKSPDDVNCNTAGLSKYIHIKVLNDSHEILLAFAKAADGIRHIIKHIYGHFEQSPYTFTATIEEPTADNGKSTVRLIRQCKQNCTSDVGPNDDDNRSQSTVDDPQSPVDTSSIIDEIVTTITAPEDVPTIAPPTPSPNANDNHGKHWSKKLYVHKCKQMNYRSAYRKHWRG